MITFLGVGMVAIPTGIISAGFVEQYGKMQQGAPRLAGELTAITLGVDSGWIGKTVADIEKEYALDIVLVRRKGKVVAPKQHYALKEGDEVAYL